VFDLTHVYDAIISAQRRVTRAKFSEFWYYTGSVTRIPRRNGACLKVRIELEPKKIAPDNSGWRKIRESALIVVRKTNEP
jgi:hypothetical protein